VRASGVGSSAEALGVTSREYLTEVALDYWLGH
jgi:hypothetical protein